MIGVNIRYGDYAPEAKENFTPSIVYKEPFVNLEQLQQYNLNVANYANPCEYGRVVLDGNSVPFPQNPEDESMGYWSTIKSSTETTTTGYKLVPNVLLTLTADESYSSKGFTFTFDTDNNVFCTDLTITWYEENTVVATKSFAPNSAFYFCENEVNNFDSVRIVFKKINMPKNRLRIRAIDFGYGTIFSGDELRNVKVIQGIDRLSENIPMNTVDFDFKSKNNFEYNFQKKQPISVYFNNDLIQTCFIEKSVRKSKYDWQINTFDYVGLLNSATFLGDVYTNKNAVDLLKSIFTTLLIPYEIDSSFSSSTLTGHIPICSCRDAVKQICFAIKAIVDTSNSDKIKILPLPTTTAIIADTNILQGQTFNADNITTSVEVTAHNFSKDAEKTTELYKGTKGIGNDIFVKFSSPCYDLSITNGTITKSSANYAIISMTSTDGKLTGYQYSDIKTVKSITNNEVLAISSENTKKFNNFTLVNNNNIDSILNLCYNESIKTTSTNMKIIENKIYNDSGELVDSTKVKVGQIIYAPTEYMGNISGRVISQRFNLNGGILIKECEII